MRIKNILSNWPYKLGAFVLAVILTSYVHAVLNPETTITLTAQVRTEGLKEGYVASLSPNKIPISFTGPKTEVEAVVEETRTQDIAAWIDLRGLGTGKHEVKISRLSIGEKLSENVKAVPAVSSVKVNIEPVVSRTLPITVKISTALDVGWTAGNPTVEPSKATISGAESMVASVRKLSVSVMPTPEKPLIDEYVPIRALDAGGAEVLGVRVVPDAAHVVIKLTESPATRTVYISPRITGHPQYPYRVVDVAASPETVVIKGPSEIINKISTLDTEIVDISGAVQNVVKKVNLSVPSGVEIEGSRRVTVSVRIEMGTGS